MLSKCDMAQILLFNNPKPVLNLKNCTNPYPHSVELQKANLQETNPASPNANGGNPNSQTALTASSSSSSSSSSSNTSNNPLASAIPLAQLLAKPGALNALTSLTALGGLTDLLGGLTNVGGPPIQTTGVHRNKSFTSRIRASNSTNVEKKADRNKFNPY